MLNIKILEAKEEDLPSILTLYGQADMDAGKVLSLDKAKEIFAGISSYPNYKVYIALLDGKAVGTFELLIMDNLAHMGTPSGVVEDVVVSKEYQGKGIGKQMMKFAVDRCREAGCYKVALSSNLKREKAHAFYESLRFKRHGYSFIIEC